jgi:transcriptional regulator with XRE-family HTH domain
MKEDYIGDNLRILRNSRNKSQQKIAEELDINRKTYVSWESNEADVKGSYIPKLAKALGVSIPELFKPSPNIPVEQALPNNSMINPVVLIFHDKESVNKLLDAMKFMNRD